MSRRIFRQSALRRHNERLERIELPRYATLRWARLWLVCGLLLAAVAGLLWAAKVPVYATGRGFVAQTGPGEAIVVALLPAAGLPPAEGQPARVELPGVAEGQALEGEVVAVEPQPLAPADARARFPLLEDTPDGPVVVARVALVGASDSLWRGSQAAVRVAVGSQSGLAYLPGLDAALTGEE